MKSKLIIAGARNLPVQIPFIEDAVNTLLEPILGDEWDFGDLQIVSGGAKGADASGEAFAKLHGCGLKMFPADWDKYGKGAGHMRNKQMANYADAALIFMNKEPSPGSSNMLAWMAVLGKPFMVVTP